MEVEVPAFTIRELARADRRAVAFTFGRLSQQSRYQRYFHAKPELADRERGHLNLHG